MIRVKSVQNNLGGLLKTDFLSHAKTPRGKDRQVFLFCELCGLAALRDNSFEVFRDALNVLS